MCLFSLANSIHNYISYIFPLCNYLVINYMGTVSGGKEAVPPLPVPCNLTQKGHVTKFSWIANVDFHYHFTFRARRGKTCFTLLSTRLVSHLDSDIRLGLRHLVSHLDSDTWTPTFFGLPTLSIWVSKITESYHLE